MKYGIWPDLGADYTLPRHERAQISLLSRVGGSWACRKHLTLMRVWLRAQTLSIAFYALIALTVLITIQSAWHTGGMFDAIQQATR